MKISKQSINDRFIDAVKYLVDNKIVQSKKQISEILELKGSKLSEILSSRMHATTEVLANFCVIYNINMGWLLTGKGDILKNSPKPYEENNNTTQVAEPEVSVYKLKTDYFGVDKQQIPLYDFFATAGIVSLFHDNPNNVPLDYISVPNAPKCDGAIFVRGDSMYPLLKAGDIICYKTIQNINNIIYGEMYLLDIDNGEDQYLTVKYIQRSDLGDKYFKLVSQNSHHDPKDEKMSNIRALAIVKVSIRYNTIS